MPSSSRRSWARSPRVTCSPSSWRAGSTPIEEVAHRAGVSKPVVYEHFGGKEGLYAVVVDREMRWLLEHITSALSTAGHRLLGRVPDPGARLTGGQRERYLLQPAR